MVWLERGWAGCALGLLDVAGFCAFTSIFPIVTRIGAGLGSLSVSPLLGCDDARGVTGGVIARTIC
jgi:hypothetical protein